MYIDSPNWIKTKKAKINPKNEDDKCFQYAATVALNFEETESRPERVSNIKPCINEYNWEGINYPSKLDDWKTFEKNNPTIALNILYTREKKDLSSIYFKSSFNPWKTNNSLNSKQEDRIILRKKFICIIKWNNINTSWWFFSFELFSFL